jgi:hypothetical protein
MLQVFMEVQIFCTVEVMNVETETEQFVKGIVLGDGFLTIPSSTVYCRTLLDSK